MPARHDDVPPDVPVEPASNGFVSVVDGMCAVCGNRAVITEGPRVSTDDCRLPNADGSDRERPLPTLSIPVVPGMAPGVVLPPYVPTHAPLGTAVALSSCSRSLPPHSRIRCSSASSRLTSFSSVCMRASLVSSMAVSVVLPGTPPGTATLPPSIVAVLQLPRP